MIGTPTVSIQERLSIFSIINSFHMSTLVQMVALNATANQGITVTVFDAQEVSVGCSMFNEFKVNF